MESKLDVPMIVLAVCNAAFAAFAIGYVARLEFSPQAIRGAAILLAVVLAIAVGIDFVGKELRKAK
jgi:hypothetical protein